MILEIEHKLFYYEHLFDDKKNSEQINNFAIRERSGYGLEIYLKQIGEIIFRSFILPTVKHIQNFVAVKALYIYALPEDKLISYYEKLGFTRLEKEEERFVHAHVKPKYDEDCIFMYQIL